MVLRCLNLNNLLIFYFYLDVLSFLNALASICLILSLVTLNSLPTSSRVLALPSSRPNLNLKTFSSLGVKVSKTLINCSFNNVNAAASAGAGASSSGIKSPKWLSSSSPIGVSKRYRFLSYFHYFSNLFYRHIPFLLQFLLGVVLFLILEEVVLILLLSLFIVSTI